MTLSILPQPAVPPDQGLGAFLAELPWTAKLAAGVLLAYVLVAITGPLWAPYGPAAVLVGPPFAPPGADHLLGTDNLGRDVFSRVVYGSRAVLIMAASSSGLAVVAGTCIGILLAYRGGWVDEIGMRVIDVLMSVPPLVLALLLLSASGNSSVLPVLTVAFLFAPRVVRVMRAATQMIVSEDYVVAAVTRGESAWSIALRELMPNVVGTVFVEFAIRSGFAVVFIGALGFLGFGAPPPAPEWGLMINEGRSNITASFWPVIGPAAAMAVLVIALNLFSEGMARAIGRSGPPSMRE